MGAYPPLVILVERVHRAFDEPNIKPADLPSTFEGPFDGLVDNV
jgi:hypothetical protein